MSAPPVRTTDVRLWYVATPYAKFAAGREAAWRMACEEAALLMREGVRVFCPIAHSYPIAMFGKILPTDHDFWMAVDRPFMEACGGIIVVMANGWRQSRGVAEEMTHFANANKPTIYMKPGIVPAGLLKPLPVLDGVS